MLSPSLAILRVQSDERLVALARAGHERPFEAIVERYRRPLLRHARRLVGEARAEDAVQQALVAAWAALQRGDDVRDLRAWLHRIVHNTALNALRGQRECAELRESLTAGGAPHDVLERRLVVRETLETLAALPERQREALLRTAIEGRSQAEVAEALGLSDGAVRQLVHRARTAVRAAATAITPLPAAQWLAAAGARGEPMSDRLGELVGAAGAAGAGATLAKAGTIAVLAGGAAAGPALVERVEPRAPSTAAAEPVREPARPRDRMAPVPIAVRAPAPRAGSRGPGSDSSGPGSGSRDDRDGSGTSGSGSSGSGSGSSGSSSGSGSSGSSGSGSDTSGSSGSDSGTSGSSGSGSDSSGSGTSGSGSSGSGSSGSGLSGSSSGSVSSGSGTSGSGTSGTSGSGSGSSTSGSGSDTAVYTADTSGSGSGSSSSSGSGSDSSGSGSGSSGSGSEPDEVESE